MGEKGNTNTLLLGWLHFYLRKGKHKKNKNWKDLHQIVTAETSEMGLGE